jgi:hypothetical protein
MGDCLLWAVFSITIVDQIFGHPEIEASFSTNEFANSR